MMPSTCRSFRKNELAAVEITALAAGAGPPANRIAARRMWVWTLGGRESDMRYCSVSFSGNLRGGSGPPRPEATAPKQAPPPHIYRATGYRAIGDVGPNPPATTRLSTDHV